MLFQDDRGYDYERRVFSVGSCWRVLGEHGFWSFHGSHRGTLKSGFHC